LYCTRAERETTSRERASTEPTATPMRGEEGSHSRARGAFTPRPRGSARLIVSPPVPRHLPLPSHSIPSPTRRRRRLHAHHYLVRKEHAPAPLPSRAYPRWPKTTSTLMHDEQDHSKTDDTRTVHALMPSWRCRAPQKTTTAPRPLSVHTQRRLLHASQGGDEHEKREITPQRGRHWGALLGLTDASGGTQQELEIDISPELHRQPSGADVDALDDDRFVQVMSRARTRSGEALSPRVEGACANGPLPTKHEGKREEYVPFLASGLGGRR
jgi:hypothetical protein